MAGPQEISVVPLTEGDVPLFKREMQRAFRIGAEEGMGECEGEILPESHIDRSLSSEGAEAYEAVVGGEMAGGAVIVTDRQSGKGSLDFLFVRVEMQGRGIGQTLWDTIERLHPEVKVWETHTPYFDKRNLHFYINRCGFHAVEFYTDRHPDPHFPEDEDDMGGMFRFEKVM